MKGLLLKDFYMAKKYCRIYFFMVVIFAVLSLSGMNNSSIKAFASMYSVMMVAMIPYNLLAYDEKFKWDLYAGSLPYSRAQLVTVKYLVAIICFASIFILYTIIYAVKLVQGATNWNEYMTNIVIILTMGIIYSSLILPFSYKFGVEKGRMISLIFVGVIWGLGFASMMILSDISPNVSGFFKEEITLTALLCLVLIVIDIAVFLISWRLSIGFYEKREL